MWLAGRLPYYKATLLDSEPYLLTCYRYIELNPVRAGMVEHPADYPWSSFHFNALGTADTLVSVHELYRRLGNDNKTRRSQYRKLFNMAIPSAELKEIREATNKAWVLGNDKFRRKIEILLERQASPKPRGGDRKSEKFRGGKQIDQV